MKRIWDQQASRGRRSTGLALALAGAFALSLACGSGTAGLVAGAGGSGGGSTPALDAFVVEGPKTAPCTLRLVAGQRVRIELFYDDPRTPAGEQPMTELTGHTGVSGNTVDLEPGDNEITWDFEGDLGAEFTDGVRLVAKRGASAITGGELVLGMGNDAPVVHAVDPVPTDPPNPESAGNVEIRLRISDSTPDPVDVTIEWRRMDDPPNAWMPATSAGLFPDGVETQPANELGEGGVQLSFFWNTNVDLSDEEDAVVFRVTADDRTEPSDPFETPGPFLVDNNEEPIVVLGTGPLVSNPDERRGIPVPFQVVDEESDLVDVVFQWRREGEDFPALPGDEAALEALLADPLQRLEKHVCTPYPLYAEGRVSPVDASTVRLPELASEQSWILFQGLAGRTLELLRPSSVPEPLPAPWLDSPVAAYPLGDGTRAVVLDRPLAGGRLSEVELATGAVVREIVSAIGSSVPGIPSAMVLERGEAAALVAFDDGGAWRIGRVELSGGDTVELAVSDGTEPAPVRGLASLGTGALVFTAGSSLFHLAYADPSAPRLARLLTDLTVPHGVAADPLLPRRLYLSERGADRIVALGVDSLAERPVVVDVAALPAGLAAPEALALERGGSRLLVMTKPPGRGAALVAVDLGTGGNPATPIGSPLGTSGATSLATGRDGLRLVSVMDAHELLVAGGVEQRRTIASGATLPPVVSVEEPFDPAPRVDQPWRVADASERLLRASPAGETRTFLWDGADAFGGLISLRAVARDDEFGLPTDALAPKLVRGGLQVDAFRLGDSMTTIRPFSVAAGDLDGDGDVDLVSANFNGDDLTIFLQDPPGSFASMPAFRLGDSSTMRPLSVAVGDVDGDGDLDVVSANNLSSNLSVFLQDPPGNFDSAPARVLGAVGVTVRPLHVTLADLDGDGGLDVVSTNGLGEDLTIFLQDATGVLPKAPTFRLTTDRPRCVATADLDGDGDLDLVAANEDEDTLTLFFQDPPGTFADTPGTVLGSSTTTDDPNWVTAVDLDGDGDVDLASANWAGPAVTTFLQTEPGEFALGQTLGGFPTTLRTKSVEAADFDGDGDLDLVSTNRDTDNLTVFFQTAPGSFAVDPLVLGDNETTFSPFSVAVEDLDGDGDADLAVANADPNPALPDVGNDLTVFFQASPGAFDAVPLVVGVSAENRTPLSVTAADLDQDGDLDLAYANRDPNPLTGTPSGNDLAVFFQISPGSFALDRLRVGDADSLDGPCALLAVDLDRDGDLDLASANERGDDLTVFDQLSPGTFADAPLRLATTSAGPCALAAADLDGDGWLDLVSGNGGGDDLSVFFQETGGGFAAAPTSLGGTAAPAAVVAVDLNRDGFLDLVSASRGGDELSVFLQASGNLPLSPSFGLATPGDPVSLVAADLDVDGHVDLVTANVAGNNLAVFYQDPGAPQLFPAAGMLTLGDLLLGGPVSVDADDLDGDGDLDLVSANEEGFDFTVFRQLLPRTFGPTPLALPLGPAFPTTVLATDLDADGDPDLVTANRFNAPLARGNLTVFFGGR